MGFFGFNYNKEGPGVAKDAPRKNRFFVFFEVYFRKFTKLVNLNLIYFLFCIPIVTIGPATAAFTYVLRNFAREEHAFVWMDFIEAFRNNWKQGLAVSLIDVIVAVLGYCVYYFYSNYITLNSGNFMGYVAFGVTVLLIVLYLFTHYYLYTVMVTLDLSLKNIYRNSFILCILGFGSNLLATIICAALIVGLVALVLYFPVTLVLIVILVPIILLSTFCFITEFAIYPTFDRYLLQPSLRTQQGLDPFEPENKNNNEQSAEEDDDNEDEEEMIFKD